MRTRAGSGSHGAASVGAGALDPPVALQRYRERLVTTLPPTVQMGLAEYRLAVARLLDGWLAEDGMEAGEERDRLLLVLVDDIAGYGPLEPLLADPEVTEVMVNGPTCVYVERRGVIEPAGQAFRDVEHVRCVIERLLLDSGRRLDDAVPMVDARLRDGSRLNAVLPPVAVVGPLLTIRRAPAQRLTLEALLAQNALGRSMAAFLHATVLGRCNLLISGGTGAGKTTLLAALAALIPHEQRIVTLEDVAELVIAHPHVAGQECRSPGADGRAPVAMRDLVRNALRMRPDRILVGEVRGAEAYDMVQAMNTGHEGSMATLHANSAADALARVEAMLSLAAPGLDIDTLRAWLGSAIDLVVHCERTADGRRAITAIAAVEQERGGPCEIIPLFLGGLGHDGFRACGRVPRGCLERMARHGIRFPPRLFRETAPAA